MREEHEEHEEVQEEVHPGPQEEEAAVPEYLLQAGLHRLKAPLEALVVRAWVEVVPCVPLSVPTLKRRRRGVKPRKGGVAGPRKLGCAHHRAREAGRVSLNKLCMGTREKYTRLARLIGPA